MWRSGLTVFAGALFGFFACLAAMAVAPGFWGAMALAALAGLVDGPSLLAALPLPSGASQRPEARGLVGASGGEHRAVRAER